VRDLEGIMVFIGLEDELGAELSRGAKRQLG